MQIVYFFGMVDFTGSGLRSAEVETVWGGHIFFSQEKGVFIKYIRQFMKAGRGSAILVQLIVLYMPSHILFELH
jgi:hypothetical protein